MLIFERYSKYKFKWLKKLLKRDKFRGAIHSIQAELFIRNILYGIPTMKCMLSNAAGLWNPYNKVYVKQCCRFMEFLQ